jgi:Lipid A 3-O-deacylase (PagL)
MIHRYLVFIISILLSVECYPQSDTAAVYKRMQYPTGLLNSNFGVSIGYIHYNFTAKNLEQGFTVSSVTIPPVGVRVNLIGHRFNKYLSANIHYMRPAGWVKYKNVNGSNEEHSVWMNIAGLTLKTQLPLAKKISWYGEAGLGIITRKGFKINNVWAIKNTSYSTGFFETGFRHSINQRWDLVAAISYSPKNDKVKQPASYFYSFGFTNNMRALSNEKLEAKRKAGYKFPRNTIQIGIATNGLGYGVNNFVSKDSPVPFFWGGDAEVSRGVSVHYHRNIFHARKVFSFDWGISAAWWQTDLQQQNFFTLSVFPVLRFNIIHTKPADYYFYYSIAGPTYISKTILDNQETGRNFTFQDLLGIGSFIGKQRKFNAEINIGHFSNGNIFPYNNGVKVPLTFCVGYTF